MGNTRLLPRLRTRSTLSLVMADEHQLDVSFALDDAGGR